MSRLKWLCRDCVTALWPGGTPEKTIGTVVATEGRSCAVCDGDLGRDAALVEASPPQPIYVSMRSLDGTEWHLSQVAALFSPTKLLNDVDGGSMVLAEVFTESSWEEALKHHLRVNEAYRLSLPVDDEPGDLADS